MNNFKILLILPFVIFSFNSPVIAQSENNKRLTNPLYELTARNIELIQSNLLNDNTVYFDLIIYHTNLPESGPFLYAAGGYTLYFNQAISNGGILSYEIVPGSSDFTNPNAIPTNPTVYGNILSLSRNMNFPVNDAPVISPIFPGTRVVKMKLSTSASQFANVPLNLSWIIPGGGIDTGTSVYAFIDDTVTNITNDGTFKIDSSNFVLPVELNNFTANVIRSNVILNWSTGSEINNSGFDIERSTLNDNWKKIGFIKGSGSSSEIINYSFEDLNLNSGKYYYRLKQTDFNGNFEYFELSNEVIIGIPGKFSLKQNYPNPFNPVTKIDFDLPENGNTSLKIYDLSGKEIMTLLNGSLNSGYYSIDLNASSLPSGVYYYRLESGNFSSIKKLVLLK